MIPKYFHLIIKFQVSAEDTDCIKRIIGGIKWPVLSRRYLEYFAVELLKVLNTPMTAEYIAKKLKRPLFKVGSSIRDMSQAGMINADGDKF